MNAINRTRTQVEANVNAIDAAGMVTVSLFGGAAALIGLWSATCLVVAMISNGPLGLVKAYFSAVIGI